MKECIKKYVYKILVTLIVVSVFVWFIAYCVSGWSKAVDKSKKVAAIKIEQSKENIKIAEEMVAKELNTSSKYFKMINGSSDFFSSGRELDSNTGTLGIFGIADFEYWMDQDLKAEVQLDGKSYMITFETKRVDTKNEEIEMYEPVKVNKIIKNVSN